MSRHTPTRTALLLAGSLIGAVVVSAASAPAAAAPVEIASALTANPPVGLTSATNPYAGAFTNAGDGFETYQRGVSSSIPFSLLDDSAVTFPGDTLGIVADADLDPFFGATDTVNDDNTSGDVSASWVFDVAGATDLSLSIDMAAMGDFETADVMTWSYAIDGAAPTPIFELAADVGPTRTYTLAGGATIDLPDPMNVGAAELSNVFQPVTAPIAGTGSSLELTLSGVTDGGSEAFAFRNIRIIGESTNGGGDDPSPGDLVITEFMQNPAAVADAAGEWFEIANVSSADVDIDGWTISDDGTDTHVIANGGPLLVPAGGTIVLGNNADTATNGGVTVDYQYSSFTLANGDDEIVLTDAAAIEFDRVDYDGGPVFPDPNGASASLDPSATDTVSNDDGTNWCAATSPIGAGGDTGTPGAVNDVCEVAPPEIAAIHDIQGSGPTVAIPGPVAVEAIVTELFESNDELDGFFVQEEDADIDADAATSEGIFVFCRGNCPAVLAPGDLVTVVGSATDFFGMSQIDMTSGSVTTTSSGNPLPAPVTVDLPATGSTQAESTFENVEGMVVTFPDTLAVSEYFELARYGQLILTETSRPTQYTQTETPDVAGYEAFLDELETRRIILDDDNNTQNDPIVGPDADEPYPYPPGGLSVDNRFRGGDTITDLTGVLHWSFAGQNGTDAWRVRPIDLGVTIASDNPATAQPDDVGGDLTAVSFNVLNYFTSLDDGPGTCGPSGTDDCRGASSVAELERQRDKIVAALQAIDGDIVGLIELENDGDDSSIDDLVDGLNTVVGAGTYDYIATGFIGTDAIKVGLIYQPASVTPVGSFAILDSTDNPDFDDTLNRPMLSQTFEDADGERLTVSVNHLKSKGSECDGDDVDPDDGQGNCAEERTAAASAIATYLATDPTGSGDPDHLVLGDLNSYAKEDPIAALESAGYTNLLAAFGSLQTYSYVFDGQIGTLDYAMSNADLTPQVTGTTAWNINADEVPIFDYNDGVQDPNESSFERESNALTVFAPDALRSSDHDPVIVGLDLDTVPDVPTCNGQPATIVGTGGADLLVGTNGPDVIVALGGNDVVIGGNGGDVICAGDGIDLVLAGNGGDWVDGGDGTDVLLGGNGPDVLIGGAGVDIVFGGNGRDTCDAEQRLACER